MATEDRAVAGSSGPNNLGLPLSLIRYCFVFYKRWISPLFGNACRFYPYCSDYAMQALEKHGLLKGSWLALKRLVRCNPYCKGGIDPVP